MAGTLSVGCPQYFKSGQKEFKESGWWTLQEKVPPAVKLADVGRAEGRLRRGSRKGYRKKQTLKPENAVTAMATPEEVSKHSYNL